MERNNLTYNVEHKLLICIEHGFAVSSSSLEKHLRTYHKIKGESLQAVLIEIENLQILDPTTVVPPNNCSRIPHLPVSIGYRCTACSHLSKHKRTIEKHLSKEHNIGHAKFKTKPTESDIETVDVQSLLPIPTYRPFVVQTPVLHAEHNSSTLISSNISSNSPLDSSSNLIQTENDTVILHAGIRDLRETYNNSRQHWQQEFEEFLSDELHVGHTPPWIRNLGINVWMQDLDVNKNDLWQLLEETPKGKKYNHINFYFHAKRLTFIACRQRYHYHRL